MALPVSFSEGFAVGCEGLEFASRPGAVEKIKKVATTTTTTRMPIKSKRDLIVSLDWIKGRQDLTPASKN